MISLFVENLAIGLIAIYPVEFFADLIVQLLDPLYRFALSIGL